MGSHARAVGFSYKTAPHGSGVWVGFSYAGLGKASWHGMALGVFFFLSHFGTTHDSTERDGRDDFMTLNGKTMSKKFMIMPLD